MEGSGYEFSEGWLNHEPNSLNYYEILGVHFEAGTDVIHAAWRLAARKHHPDRVSHLGRESELIAENKMTLLNEAWSVLRDPSSRRRYDIVVGLRFAICSKCGGNGHLRAAAGGSSVGLCDQCFQNR